MNELVQQQRDGCFFVCTWGEYSDYAIEAVFGGWMQALIHYRDMYDPFDDKRLEVWKGENKLGEWRECVTKAEWDVLGTKHIEKGVKWQPEGASE